MSPALLRGSCGRVVEEGGMLEATGKAKVRGMALLVVLVLVLLLLLLPWPA